MLCCYGIRQLLISGGFANREHTARKIRDDEVKSVMLCGPVGAGVPDRRRAPAQQPGGAQRRRSHAGPRARAVPPHCRGGARGGPSQRPLRHVPARQRLRGQEVGVSSAAHGRSAFNVDITSNAWLMPHNS